METNQIPTHKVDSPMLPEVRGLRTKAPGYLVSLIENGVLGNIESASVLEGGEVSACYFLKTDDGPRVVKLRHKGIEAEVEALKAWQAQGVHIPEVKAVGVVPMTLAEKDPVKYLVLRGIVGRDGLPALTGDKYLTLHPDMADEVGKSMGIELGKMHQAKSDGLFGGFSDMWGKDQAAVTLAEHFTNKIHYYSSFLLELGIPNDQIELVVKNIKSISFPVRGTYVHGDFGMHSVLIEDDDPSKVSVFDPNPIIGDPYWDIALRYNKAELNKAKYEAQPDNDEYKALYERDKTYLDALMGSYKKIAGVEIDGRRLLANQVVQEMSGIKYAEGKISLQQSEITANGQQKVEDNRGLELRVRKDLFTQRFNRLASLIK